MVQYRTATYIQRRSGHSDLDMSPQQPLALTDALTSLGGDLTLSVSFAVAKELNDAATDSELGDTEFIAVLVVLTSILAALPSLVYLGHVQTRRVWRYLLGRPAVPTDTTPHPNSLTGFTALLFNISHSVLLGTTSQVVASKVQKKVPIRGVRIVTLLSIAVFFLFLQSTSSIARIKIDKHRE